jgi:hypothetical protein
MIDLGMHLAGASESPPYQQGRAWLRDNDRFRLNVLDLLASSGPLDLA